MDLLRSTLFNLLFYLLTALACIVCLPTLFFPRSFFMWVVSMFVHGVYFLERYVLGLKLEVRGAENLPAEGSYIIAAKHQSSYETFKLHLLFKDPAIILKRELLKIPLWGLYLKKSDPIAINRKDPKGASHSIQQETKRVAAQGRPIVIFPQGTRVSAFSTSKDHPYKVGVARMQEGSGLPIIPMAINAGVYWPKHKWVKHSGTVVFSFLPAIEAGKYERAVALGHIEQSLETESLSLANEAREAIAMRKPNKKALLVGGFMAVILFGFYSFAWFEIAKQTKREYVQTVSSFSQGKSMAAEPKISGFPGKIKLHSDKELIQNSTGSFSVENLRIEGWPLPFTPITVETDAIELKYFRWKAPIRFDRFQGKITLERTRVNILEAALHKDTFKTDITGAVDGYMQPPYLDLMVTVEKPEVFMNVLAQSWIIKANMAMLLSSALTSFQDEHGQTHIPLYQKDSRLFLGPLPIYSFTEPRSYNPELDARLRPIR